MAIARSTASADTLETQAADSAGWRAFVTAQSDEQFFSAWLHLLCQQSRGVAAAVVLLRSEQDNTFAPVALWPPAPRDLSFLSQISEEALRLNAGALRPAPAGSTGYYAALPLQSHDRTLGVVALEIAVRLEADAQLALRQVQWGLGWPQNYLGRRHADSVGAQLAQIGSVMETLAATLRPLPLQQVLLELVNQVCRQLKATRVALGLRDSRRMRAVAISEVAYFENHSDGAAHYAAAMQEASEAFEPIRFVTDPNATSADRPAHAQLAAHSRATAILTVPLHLNGRTVGAICAERDTQPAFSDEELNWLHSLAALLPAIVEQKREAERSLAWRIGQSIRTLVAHLIGPRHLLSKCLTAAVIVLITLLAAVHVEYRVTAHTVIEGEIQRSAVAPFDGFIQSSAVRAGDIVQKGQLLCELDDRNLQLEREKWLNEREQHARELRQALANQDLPNLQIVEAQLQQSEAHLQLTEQQLGKARVLAPFDGVVVSGDLTQLIGSPIERGKKLFDVAPLQAYRVILEVDERDVRHVAVGQTGTLLVTSVTDHPITFRVSTVTPVATAKDGRNYFRVEAHLDSAPTQLRPGMEGVGKVRAGRRQLWWVSTHSLNEWLQLWLWRWIP